MTNNRYRKTHLGNRELQPATQMMSYGYDPFLSEGAVKPPVFLTSTFAFQTAEQAEHHFHLAAGRLSPAADESNGLVYSRFNHPNMEILEDRLALLDGSEGAAVTSSGMSAIATVFLGLLKPGDVIVQSAPLYGGTEGLISGLLAGWGVRTVQLPSNCTKDNYLETFAQAAKLGNVAMVFLEAPANPTNDMVDFAVFLQAMDSFYSDKTEKPVTVCDNTLLGPLFQKPRNFGIDICVYSLTKYVGGHSDLVAGGITADKQLLDQIRKTRSTFGTQLDPHSCWMLLRSLETLGLRMERASNSAEKIASWLASNRYLRCRVLHADHDLNEAAKRIFKNQTSACGSTFSFVLDGNRDLAFQVLNNLQLFKLAVSLGGSESLVCHPASTTHSGVSAIDRDANGVEEGLIRLSIGLEDPQDLIADLEKAFSAVG
jgi:methionine-gamma-lyase